MPRCGAPGPPMALKEVAIDQEFGQPDREGE
jgi:hypothetical protein